MKKGWQERSLEALVELDSPITYGVVKPGAEGDVPFVRGGDILDGRVLQSQLRTITKVVSDQYKRTLLRGGELLICLVGQPGQVAVAPESLAGANIARQVGLIRLCQKSDPSFLSYFLQSPEGQQKLGTYTGGSVQQVINLADLRTVLVPVPPLPEQQRIVGVLDEAFDGLARATANAEQNLRNARALFESHLQSVFTQRGEGWVEKSVKEIAAPAKGSIRTGPFGSQLLHSEFVDEGIAVLGIDNAVANEFRWGKNRFIAPEKYRQLERYTVHPGDVLITIMGTCGRCAIVPDNIPTAINTKHICCITLDQKQCLPGYLHSYFLHSPQSKEYLFKHAKGAIMAGLNMGLIQELPVMLPPVKAQAAIVQTANDLRAETQRLESIYQQKLAALGELKKSLLHQAFSGKL